MRLSRNTFVVLVVLVALAVGGFWLFKPMTSSPQVLESPLESKARSTLRALYTSLVEYSDKKPDFKIPALTTNDSRSWAEFGQNMQRAGIASARDWEGALAQPLTYETDQACVGKRIGELRTGTPVFRVVSRKEPIRVVCVAVGGVVKSVRRSEVPASE